MKETMRKGFWVEGQGNGKKEESEYIFSHTDLILELQEEQEGGKGQGSGTFRKKAQGDGLFRKEGQGDGPFRREEKGQGFRVERREQNGGRLREIVITIEDDRGERIFGKPRGVYITLEGVNLAENDGAFHEEMSALLAKHLERLLGEREKVLIAGLGNRDVTPDALGPLVVDNLLITGHLGEVSFFEKMRSSMAVAPGVMAQTGMETREILQGIIGRTKPEALVVIDALAAKTAERLNRTVQISDAGIAPGAGVGNERREISEKTMGIPVIAIGVPTVISIPAVAGDILSAVLTADKTEESSAGSGQVARGADGIRMTGHLREGEEEKELSQGTEAFLRWTDRQRYEFLSQRLPKELFGLFVTPKEIDESVKRISYTISEGINRVIARTVS